MDLLDVYELGMILQYARLMRHFCPVVQGENQLLEGLRQIHDLLEREGIAKNVLGNMADWIEKLHKDYPNEKMMIEKKDALAINDAVETWKQEIKKDLLNIHVLRVELQSGLNPDELRKLADKLPSEFVLLETWKKLTDIEKNDFSDAARCLLLGTATPSVMVALRGAEASIRNYYRCKTKTDPQTRTWRQITTELKGKAKDLGIEGTFIGYLDYIGDAKRNFAQHPNKIYSLREAVIMFMQIVGLIEDIYTQI